MGKRGIWGVGAGVDLTDPWERNVDGKIELALLSSISDIPRQVVVSVFGEEIVLEAGKEAKKRRIL